YERRWPGSRGLTQKDGEACTSSSLALQSSGRSRLPWFCITAVAVLPGYSSGSIPWVRSIPASLEASFATEIEPFIDSCDGIANTRGWSQVVVEVAFKWH